MVTGVVRLIETSDTLKQVNALHQQVAKSQQVRDIAALVVRAQEQLAELKAIRRLCEFDEMMKRFSGPAVYSSPLTVMLKRQQRLLSLEDTPIEQE